MAGRGRRLAGRLPRRPALGHAAGRDRRRGQHPPPADDRTRARTAGPLTGPARQHLAPTTLDAAAPLVVAVRIAATHVDVVTLLSWHDIAHDAVAVQPLLAEVDRSTVGIAAHARPRVRLRAHAIVARLHEPYRRPVVGRWRARAGRQGKHPGHDDARTPAQARVHPTPPGCHDAASV